MADRLTPHHTITPAVAQTLLTYEKDAEIFLQQWGRREYKAQVSCTSFLSQLADKTGLE
jgi:hypothetical protein